MCVCMLYINVCGGVPFVHLQSLHMHAYLHVNSTPHMKVTSIMLCMYLNNISREIRHMCKCETDSGTSLRYSTARLNLIAPAPTVVTRSGHYDNLFEVGNVY